MPSASSKRYKRKYSRPRTQVARERRAKEEAAQKGQQGSGSSESESEEGEYVPEESSPRKRSMSDVVGDDNQASGNGQEKEDRPREDIKRFRTEDWNDDKTLVRPEGGFKNKDGKKIKKPKAEQRSYPEIVPSPQKLNGWVRNLDLQQLVLYILAEGTGPSWILVKNRPAIKRVVVLLVPGLSLDILDGRTPLPPRPGKKDSDAVEDKNGIQSSEVGLKEQEGDQERMGQDGEDDAHGSTTSAGQWTYVARNEYTPIPLAALPKSDTIKEMKKMFTHVFPTRAGGDNNRIYSPVQNLLKSPIPPKRQQKPSGQKHNERLKISALLLNPLELVEHSYPIHSSQAALLEDPDASAAVTQGDDWLETDLSNEETLTVQSGSVTEGRPVLAIDCEMVKTSAGSELARISIVDWDGKVVYDTLVKPDAEVTDYVTMYSGITEEMLKDVTTRLVDVQKKLQGLLTPSTVLVGHSLNTDLHALHYAHPHIADTSVIYDCARGKPYKPGLKWLAQKHLKLDIQTKVAGKNKGHDSIEDANACLKLLKMKLERGRSFGTITADEESIFERLERVSATSGVVDYGNPANGNGYKARLNIGCSSDEEVCAGIGKCVNGEVQTGTAPVNFVWGRLLTLEKTRNWKSNWQKFSEEVYKSNITADSPPIEIPPLPPAPSAEDLSNAVHESVKSISEIYESLPKCTAFIVYSGTGDPREMARLNAINTVYRKEFSVKKWDQLSVRWTDDEEQALKKAVSIARKGVAFVTVK